MNSTENIRPSLQENKINRRMTEEEIPEVVQDGLIGINPELAEINILHEF